MKDPNVLAEAIEMLIDKIGRELYEKLKSRQNESSEVVVYAFTEQNTYNRWEVDENDQTVLKPYTEETKITFIVNKNGFKQEALNQTGWSCKNIIVGYRDRFKVLDIIHTFCLGTEATQVFEYYMIAEMRLKDFVEKECVC